MANKKSKTPSIRARITVYPRPEILDPQGKAIASALTRLGFDGVADVRAGKSFDVQLDNTDASKAEDTLRQMCKDLLVNSVVEDFEIQIVDNGAAP